jgi:hypothetical protein
MPYMSFSSYRTSYDKMWTCKNCTKLKAILKKLIINIGFLFPMYSSLSEYIGKQMGSLSNLFRLRKRATVEECQMVRRTYRGYR